MKHLLCLFQGSKEIVSEDVLMSSQNLTANKDQSLQIYNFPSINYKETSPHILMIFFLLGINFIVCVLELQLVLMAEEFFSPPTESNFLKTETNHNSLHDHSAMMLSYLF